MQDNIAFPPPCCAAPTMLGANAWTLAMKLRPMFEVICSTSCRLPGPPLLYCLVTYCASCPRVVLRRSLHHSRNFRSWHSASFGDPRLRMLVPSFPPCATARHQFSTSCHLSGRTCHSPPLMWSDTIFAVYVVDVPPPVSQEILL
jgi:hypothetical protein